MSPFENTERLNQYACIVQRQRDVGIIQVQA